MKFKTFLSGVAVISPFVFFGFVVQASEKQSLVDPNLKDVQQFLKGETLINNPALNHLPNGGPNYLAQATTFVGEPIVVQDEIKVLGNSPSQSYGASDKSDFFPKITVNKEPDKLTVSVLKEFSFGHIPGESKGHGTSIHYDVSNNGDSHHHQISHGPEYSSHSYGADDIGGSTDSHSYNPSPPIQEFIDQGDQSSYSSSQQSNDGLQQSDNGYYNLPGDSSQQFQSGGYDSQQQSNGGYDGEQQQQSGGYDDGGSQQQLSGGYDQGVQSSGGYDQGGQSGGYDQGGQSGGGYDQGGQASGGLSLGQAQQQLSLGGYDQGLQLQQPSGGYDQGQQQQQLIGGYQQESLQQQSIGIIGGYDQAPAQQIEQPTGGYNNQQVTLQQQSAGGYDQQQQSAAGYDQQQQSAAGYDLQQPLQQQSVGGYDLQQPLQQQSVGGYDQALSQQNQQINNGGYDQGVQGQQQQSSGGYNNNDQASSSQQQNTPDNSYGLSGNKQQDDLTAKAQEIHNNVGERQQKLIKSLGLDSIIQQANLVFKSEQLLNRPQNSEIDTIQLQNPVQNNNNDNLGQYGPPANQAQSQTQNVNSQYGAPSQNVNNQYGAPGQRQSQAQNVNNQYGVPGQGQSQAQNVNNQYGVPGQGQSQAQNVNNQYGVPAQAQSQAQNVNSQYGAPSQNVNSQYGAPSQAQSQAQNVNSQYGAPSQNVNNQYGAPASTPVRQQQNGVITPAVMEGWIPLRPVFSRSHYAKGGNQGNKDNIWNAKVAAVVNGAQSSKSNQGGYSANNNGQSNQGGYSANNNGQSNQGGNSANNNAQSNQGGYSSNNNGQSNQGGYSSNNNGQSNQGDSSNNNFQSGSLRINAVRNQAVQGGYSVGNDQSSSTSTRDYQVNNLVLDKSGVLQTYDSNKAAKVIIHAQNVIIKSDIPVEKASVGGQRDITPLLQQQLRTLMSSQAKDSSINAKTNAFVPIPNYFKPSANPQPLVLLNNNNNGGSSGGYNAPVQGGGYNLAASVIQAAAFSNNNNNNVQPPMDYGAGLQPPLPYQASNNINVAAKAPSGPTPSSPPMDYGAGLQPPLPYAPLPNAAVLASALQNLHVVLPAQTSIPLPPAPQGQVLLAVGAPGQLPGRPNGNSRPPMDYHAGLYAPPPFSHNNNNNNRNNAGRGNRIPEGKIAGDPVKFASSHNTVKVLSPNVDINIKAKANSPPRFKSQGKHNGNRDYGSSVGYSVGKLQEQITSSSTEKAVIEGDQQFPIQLSEETPGKALPTFFGKNIHPFAYLATSTNRPLRDQSSSKFRYKPAKRPSLFSISFGNPQEEQRELRPGSVHVGPTVRVPRPTPGSAYNKTRSNKHSYKGRSKQKSPNFELDDSFFESSNDNNKFRSRPNPSDFESSEFGEVRGRGKPRRPSDSFSEQSNSGYTFDFGRDPYTRLGKDLFYGVYDILNKKMPSFDSFASVPRSIMSTMNKIKLPPVQLQFYRL